jgi:hypothetical protein
MSGESGRSIRPHRLQSRLVVNGRRVISLQM